MLMYLKDPKYKKEEVPTPIEDYLSVLNPDEYLGMQARFSSDYSRLCYLSSDSKFLSHSSNYQLKYIDWPVKGAETKPVTVVDYVNEYP